MADSQIRYDRVGGPRGGSLRAGDAEREAVAEILRREHVNGRLDAAEFQERLDRCLVAKTYADLDELVADLPGAPPPGRRRSFARTPLPPPLLVLPFAALALIVATGGRVLWLVFPLFVFFVLRHVLWRPGGRGYHGYERR